MGHVERDLKRAAISAKVLVENMRDILDEDIELLRDTLEGETNLIETISACVDRIKTIEALSGGLDERVKKLKYRKERLEAQAERLKTSVHVAMGMSDLPRLELDHATVTVKMLPPKVMIVTEADIPTEYLVQQDPKPDKRAILAALKEKHPVPGCTLSNASQTIQITDR